MTEPIVAFRNFAKAPKNFAFRVNSTFELKTAKTTKKNNNKQQNTIEANPSKAIPKH
jgi:hypothetical protein